MKKISVIALMICTLFIFAGCGAGNKVPSEKEMKNSLIEQGANIYYLNYENQELEYSDFELTKRKTDEAYDEAYISAVLENDDYIITVKYILYHSYYDVGGWIMDYYEAYPISISPNGVNTNEAIVTEELSNFFNRFEITDNIVGTTAEGYPFDAYTFEGYFDYKYASEKFKGEYAEIFIYDTWEPNYYIVNEGIDWSGFIGTWRFEHYDEFIEIEITDINTVGDELIIDYIYSTSPWVDDAPWYTYFNKYENAPKSNKERTEGSVALKLRYREANMGNMVCEALSEIYLNFWLPAGGYNQMDAAFAVHLDVEKGLYIKEFYLDYKKEGITKPWYYDESEVYFEKIK